MWLYTLAGRQTASFARERERRADSREKPLMISTALMRAADPCEMLLGRIEWNLLAQRGCLFR